jgi:hypothetical protein
MRRQQWFLWNKPNVKDEIEAASEMNCSQNKDIHTMDGSQGENTFLCHAKKLSSPEIQKCRFWEHRLLREKHISCDFS